MKKQIGLFLVILLSVFISVKSLLNITEVFQLTNNLYSTLDYVVTNNGSELYASSLLTNYTNVVRKYVIAGNTYYLKGEYEPAVEYTFYYYDFIFVVNGYLISGSKIGGYVRIWNARSFQYIRQLQTGMYFQKLMYCNSATNPKFFFTANTTLSLMYFTVNNLPNSITVQSATSPNGTNWKADNIQISPSGNYLIVYNQTTSTATVIFTSNFASVGTLQGGANYGFKSGCWSLNQSYFFQTTHVMSDGSGFNYVTKIEIFNFLTIILNNVSSTIVNVSSSQTISGKSNATLYVDRQPLLVIPAKNFNDTYLTMNSLNYPIRRMLQTSASYNFSMSGVSLYKFFYQTEKCFFGISVGGTMYFYSFYGTCLENQYFNTYTLTCVNCSTGCGVCTYQVCVVCLDGYILNQTLGVCLLNGTNNAIGNPTIQTPTNPTIDYSTNNSTIVYPTINITNNTSPSNITTTTNTQQINQLRKILTFLREFYLNIILKILNKVPGSRKVLKPWFSFFVNLDDLWLYYYHKRTYCNTTVQMFESIKTFENQKWQAIRLEDILNNVLINQQQIQQQFQYLNEISKKRDNFIQIQKRNNGYFINTMQFYCSNLILIVLVYLSLRTIFYLTKNNFISIFFRQYSFWIYLGIIILQGNMQYFAYLITNEMKMLLNISIFHKMFNCYNLVTFFMMLVFSIICYFLIYFNYKQKHKKYFFENVKVTGFGVMYMVVVCFLRNFVLGFLHSYLDDDVLAKLKLLAVFELLFSIVFVLIVSRNQVRNHIRQWVLIICTYLRLIIVFSFYLDYQIKSYLGQLQDLQATLFILYMLMGIFSLGYESIMFIYQSKCLLSKYMWKRKIKREKTQPNITYLLNINKRSNQKSTPKFSLSKTKYLQNKQARNKKFLKSTLRQDIIPEEQLQINPRHDQEQIQREQKTKKTHFPLFQRKLNTKVKTLKRVVEYKRDDMKSLVVLNRLRKKDLEWNQNEKQ